MAAGRVIKAGYKAYQARFTAARAAYYAHCFALFHAEAYAAQRRFAARGIAEFNVFKTYFLVRIDLSGLCIRAMHVAFHVKRRAYSARAGKRLRYGYNKRSKFNKLHQYLGHVVIQRHYLSLSQNSAVHPQRANVYKHRYAKVYHYICGRIHSRADAAHYKLQLCERCIALAKLPPFLILLAKCPYDANAGKILPRYAKHLVQPRLHLFIHRDAPKHYAEHHYGQKRYCDHEHKRRLNVYREGHYHCAEHNERRAQKKPKRKVHAGLHLIYVPRYAGDKRAGALGIEL